MITDPRSFIQNNLTLWFTSTRWYPFVELDTGDIIGPGHQDKESFSHAVRSFLHEAEGDSEYTSKDIRWEWATVEDGLINLSESDVPGAVPVTCLWGLR